MSSTDIQDKSEDAVGRVDTSPSTQGNGDENETVRSPLSQRTQNAKLWEFEPSGHVGEMEIRAGDEQLTADLEFRQQKDAFNKIPPLVLVPYRGQFVASRNGEIVDSDNSLPELTRRFFGERGDVPVYITRVGEPIRITISTPLFR